MESKSIVDFSKLKVPDLKKELKSRGLSTGGNKTELVERLLTASKSKLIDIECAESGDVDDLDDDLLNDDDSDHDDQDNSEPHESVLELDETLDISPPIKVTKRPLEEDTEVEPKPLKKLILNRKPSVATESSTEKPVPPPASLPASVPQPSNSDEVEADDDKKVIKLGSLSTKERLNMRAKKFGTPLSVDAKKAARLERFGGSASSAVSTAAITKATSNLDILKKRAERFGSSVSKVMSNMEQEQRLELRKARFGNLPTACVTETDKAKQRLERFKTPVT